MAKRKSSRARRKSKKGYSKLIALCAVAVVLVTAAVLLTVLPSRCLLYTSDAADEL